MIAVATPEEMPVNETIALADALARDGLALDLVIVNALYPARFEPSEIDELGAGADQDSLGARALGAARRAVRARRARPPSASSATACASTWMDSSSSLPYLFADHVGLHQLDILATALEQAAAL